MYVIDVHQFDEQKDLCCTCNTCTVIYSCLYSSFLYMYILWINELLELNYFFYQQQSKYRYLLTVLDRITGAQPVLDLNYMIPYMVSYSLDPKEDYYLWYNFYPPRTSGLVFNPDLSLNIRLEHTQQVLYIVSSTRSVHIR